MGFKWVEFSHTSTLAHGADFNIELEHTRCLVSGESHGVVTRVNSPLNHTAESYYD